MRNFSSTIVPIFSGLVMLLSDTAFGLAQNGNWNAGSITLTVVFNILVFMSLWSLLATMLSDPGYVPKNYEYDVSKMNKNIKS